MKIFDVVFVKDKKMINHRTKTKGHYYIITSIDNNGFVTLNTVTHDKSYRYKIPLKNFDKKSNLLLETRFTDAFNNLIHIKNLKKVKTKSRRGMKKYLDKSEKKYLQKNVISKIKKFKKDFSRNKRIFRK
ncbi:MAG: hypothetical protein PHT03_02610 [Bacilli bacterium]|nr:hypothetical protein [Bacilli bacterium]